MTEQWQFFGRLGSGDWRVNGIATRNGMELTEITVVNDHGKQLRISGVKMVIEEVL